MKMGLKLRLQQSVKTIVEAYDLATDDELAIEDELKSLVWLAYQECAGIAGGVKPPKNPGPGFGYSRKQAFDRGFFNARNKVKEQIQIRITELEKGG